MTSIINWDRINSRLPYARSRDQLEMRRRLWEAIDVNDNGFVSLAEITRVHTCELNFLVNFLNITLQGS